MRDGGHGERRFLPDTNLTLGALFVVLDLRNELTVVCPGMSVSSPANVEGASDVHVRNTMGLEERVCEDSFVF